MGVFVLNQKQYIQGISIEEAWDFFSSPKNLKVITPPHMGFDIISEMHSEKMYAGQIIRYKVKPFAGIPMSWTSEISQVNKPHFFIDEQRQGPYKMWHHQHHFEEKESGVLMTDIIHYWPPMGLLGNIANAILIKKQLKDIFDYRKIKIEELFHQ
jgi:ligand-binding SRPBCC domain-containing protein